MFYPHKKWPNDTREHTEQITIQHYKQAPKKPTKRTLQRSDTKGIDQKALWGTTKEHDGAYQGMFDLNDFKST
jgi:hypothetical protein